MNIRRLSLLPALAAMLAAGCASSGYSPPAERSGDRCPVGEVWVCEDRYPSRIENENEPDAFCRCEDPTRLR